MAFIDGNHRITAAGFILGSLPVNTSMYGVASMECSQDIINNFRTKFQQTFYTRIHTNYDCSLPEVDKMSNISRHIKDSLDKSFGLPFADITVKCKEVFDNYRVSHNDTFVNLDEDSWLSKAWKKPSRGKNDFLPIEVLQIFIVPEFFDQIVNNYYFSREVQQIIRQKYNFDQEKEKLLKSHKAMEFNPVSLTTYKNKSENYKKTSSSGVFSVPLKAILHLLTVASYDSAAIKMLNNLAIGNFNGYNAFPQNSSDDKLISYDSIHFAALLHQTITSLVDDLYRHLMAYLKRKGKEDKVPRAGKIKQMFFLHFLKKMLPVFLQLRNNPKIPAKRSDWLSKKCSKVKKTHSYELTLLDHILFCYQRLFRQLLSDMSSTILSRQYVSQHDLERENTVKEGVIKLTFEDIRYSDGNSEGLSLEFKDFIGDLVYDRKSHLYEELLFTSKQNNKQHTQENLENNQEDSELSEKSQKSKTSKKRRSTSTKNLRKNDKESLDLLECEAKKVKHGVDEMETMEALPEACKEQLKDIKKSVYHIYDILGGLMGTSHFESLTQEHSADNGTETDERTHS